MNFLERLVLKKIMVQKIKDLAAKYPMDVHAIAIITVALGAAFANPVDHHFHDLVLRWAAHLPADLVTLVVVAIGIVQTYYNAQK